MQTTVENPQISQNSPNTVFQPSSSKSPENSPINLTQNQPSPPVDSPKHSPEIEDVSPSPTTTIPSPKDSPPVLVKMKKSKSFDSSKIRRSSRILSGAGKKPVVDTTVHVIDQSDSEIDLLEKEIDEFELEPFTSTKSEPVKTKKSPTPKKKEVKTAVKVPKTKKKIDVKKSKEKLLPAPLIQPKDEEIFQKYWMTKPVAVSRLYNFAELSIGGVDLEKFVEPFEWKSFFQIKETVYPLLVQAFYYNAQVFPDKDMITSNIKDVELVIDPYVVGSLIGIKSEGLEVYGNDWTLWNIKYNIQLLFLSLTAGLFVLYLLCSKKKNVTHARIGRSISDQCWKEKIITWSDTSLLQLFKGYPKAAQRLYLFVKQRTATLQLNNS
ncbi:hypothetical protein TSUD_95200 [Trifolium subterraneum]|uniref:Uncharacterized protein n=1 Tax=Trifolium subterraneum TaxID=3900 RepID=A0A2Z6MUS6_TRISU|nr:hypothetical protein TSUD_95200 [Trifolium subterraneum]